MSASASSANILALRRLSGRPNTPGDAADDEEAKAMRAAGVINETVKTIAENWVKKEKVVSKGEQFVVEMRNRALATRVEQHQVTEKALHLMQGDVEEAISKGLKTRQTLDSLESRIVHLRNSMRKTNNDTAVISSLAAFAEQSKGRTTGDDMKKTAAILQMRDSIQTSSVGRTQTAADLVRQELEEFPEVDDTEPCPKCGRIFLPGMLYRHLEDCDGSNAFTHYSDSDDFSDSGSDSDSSQSNGSGLPPRAKRKHAEKRANYLACSICLRKFEPSRLEKHYHICKQKRTIQEARINETATEPRTEGATAPGPPLALRSLAPTPESLTLMWDPPVSDGGTPIFDYHIEYFKRTHIPVSRRETKVEDIPQTTVTTSRWIQSTPTSHKGFQITNLFGSTEYVNFRVRAVNEKGPGPWCEPLPLLRTLACIAPGSPLHLRLLPKESPNSFHIQWEAPLRTGGSSVIQYEVRFKQHIRSLATAVKLSVPYGQKYVPHKLLLPASKLHYEVQNLMGGSEFVDIQVCAITEAGLISPPSDPIPVVHTTPMTREEEIEFELRLKRMDRRLELEVWHENRPKTMNRLKFITLLEEELDGIRAQRRAKHEERLKAIEDEKERRREERKNPIIKLANVIGTDLDEPAPPIPVEMMNLEDSFGGDLTEVSEVYDSNEFPPGAALDPTFDTRDEQVDQRPGLSIPESQVRDDVISERIRDNHIKRSQFEFRIQKIEDATAKMEVQLLRLQSRKAQLRHVLIAAERRYRELMAELWHLKSYTGSHIDSTILHGTSQRFPVSELRDLITGETTEIRNVLLNGRKEMLQIDGEATKLKFEKDRSDQALQERKLAYHRFEARESKILDCLKYGVRKTTSSAYMCLQAWKEYTAAERKNRTRLLNAVKKWQNRDMCQAFLRWRDLSTARTEYLREKALEEHRNEPGGLGNRLLRLAEVQRGAAITDAEALLSWIKTVEGNLDSISASLTQRRQLRALGTLRVTTKGPKHAETSDSMGVIPEHRRIGLNAEHTQPIQESQQSEEFPFLNLVDTRQHAGPLQTMSKDTYLDLILTAKLVAASRDDELIVKDFVETSKHKLQIELFGAKVLEKSTFGDAVESYTRSVLLRAEGYFNTGNYAKCLLEAKKAELVWGYRKDTRGLLAVYRLLSRLLEKVNRADLALVHWGRCLEMSREEVINDPLLEAEALEGRGRCLLARGETEDALRAFEDAEDIYELRNDALALARVYRAEAQCMDILLRSQQAETLRAKAEVIDSEAQRKLASGIQRLKDLELSVIGMGTDGVRKLRLEQAGPTLPLLRQQMKFLQSELWRLQRSMATTKQLLDRKRREFELLGTEADRAEATEAETMSTSFITGFPREFEINDLRRVLRLLQEQCANEAAAAEKEYLDCNARKDSVQREQKLLMRHIESETREISTLIHSRYALRCVGLNVANRHTNHVLGIHAGGVTQLAGSSERQVYAFRTLDGGAANAFLGEPTDRPTVGEPVGHSKHVTSLAFFGNRIYSGSADATIRVWAADKERGWGARTPIDLELEEEEQAYVRQKVAEEKLRQETARRLGDTHVKGDITIPPYQREPDAIRRRKAGLLQLLLGHSSTVTSLAVNHRVLLSGGADKLILIWHPETGQLLRRIRGHEMAVSALAIDDNYFASGGADCAVRLWKISAASIRNPAKVVDLVQRFQGHKAAISALYVLENHVVSGALDGEIIVWDSANGSALRRHLVHPGRPVVALQFDFVKIVSSGGDGNLVFTDLYSGEPLQTNEKPHGDAQILTVAFDTDNLITVASDGGVLLWNFRGGKPMPLVKTHGKCLVVRRAILMMSSSRISLSYSLLVLHSHCLPFPSLCSASCW